jgi:3-deoxy-D-manno-octulosonic-acid transferase
VVGNLKFDAAKLEERRILDVGMVLRQLGVAEGSPILVAGSTHDGEESVMAEVYQRLRVKIPNLFLVLAPRHFERGKAVGRELEAKGVPFFYRSNMGVQTQLRPNEVQCLLLNTTGELKYFYEHADAIFIGKSLTSKGGQNPIEAGALAKAMVFGPNMQNFEAIAGAMVTAGGAIQVADINGLETALAMILSDKARAASLGANALAVVKENLGAIERTVDMILAGMEKAR